MTQQTIGRYEIVTELGRGGMGIVYRAIDPTIRRTVALKTLRLDTQADKPEEVLRRFKHEAQLAGGMNHPNIVTIYDAGDDGSIFYIAMEFIEGKTLQEILLEQRLPIETIIQVSRQICSALDYAHQRGVVHRDIKPANVMGGSLHSLKIMDFGIAKSDLGLTVPGQVLGTPAYMSPEQVMGRPLDGRSDLFSFAVMVYQMVTCEMPFMGNTATTIIYKIANEHPIPPSDLDVTIHPGLSAVITKALSKNPDDRFQTGAALANALENYKSQPAIARQAAVVSPDSPTVTMLRQVEATRPMPASPSSSPAVRSKVTPPAGKKIWPWLAVSALAVLVLAFLALANKHRQAPPATTLPVATLPAATQPETAKPPQSEAVAPPVHEKIETSHFAELRINSNPAGATVTINGKSEVGWITPFVAKKLSPGNYEIAFSKSDYVSQTRRLKLVEGQTTRLNAEMILSGGDLVLNSDPPGAFIFVDNKKLPGQVTPAQVHVAAGEHSVMLRMPGFQEENTTVEIKDGENYPFSPTLAKAAHPANGSTGGSNQQLNPQQAELFKQALREGKGIIAIFTDPPGASISINGRVMPKTSPFRAPVPPGDYQVTVTMDGYRPLQRRITVEAGKPTRIQAKLIPN